MNRVALDFGIFKIYWYSIFILLGVISALTIITKEMKKEEIPNELLTDLIFNTILIGILGARLYYVLFNLDYYLKNLVEVLEIWNGGLAIHGAILFGGIYILHFCRKNHLNTLKILDIIVVGLILGQAIGRWGNFFNQEAHGPIATYQNLKEIYIPEFIIQGMNINGIYYHPTFLYESIWNFAGFILLYFIRKYKKLKTGILSGIYLIWYSTGRFFIERLRTDSLMIGNIKMAELISIILIIVGIILIRKKEKENEL